MSSPSPTSVTINGRLLELVLGDITQQLVDVIVNAANSRLAGGSGVDGAIHRVGGPAIVAETRRRYPEGCPTGAAVISSAGNLPTKYVIHAVGPIWNGGQANEREMLAAAYRSSLELATAHDCQTVAFPALSAGAYRFPVDEASRIAINTTALYLGKLVDDRPPNTVRFVLFSSETMVAFQQATQRAIDSRRSI